MGGKNRERLQLLSKGLQGGSISKSLRSKFFILFSCSPNFQETSLSLSLFFQSVCTPLFYRSLVVFPQEFKKTATQQLCVSSQFSIVCFDFFFFSYFPFAYLSI